MVVIVVIFGTYYKFVHFLYSVLILMSFFILFCIAL